MLYRAISQFARELGEIKRLSTREEESKWIIKVSSRNVSLSLSFSHPNKQLRILISVAHATSATPYLHSRLHLVARWPRKDTWVSRRCRALPFVAEECGEP